MELPIINLLKTKSQKDIARLQDEVITVVQKVLPDAVLHGGTAIWRCYNGKRFSVDLDMYAKSETLKEKLLTQLIPRQLSLVRYRETNNVIYSTISDQSTEVKLEISKRHLNGVIMPYVKVDGSKTSILTLTPKELIFEKIAAYSNRRLARDIYDLYLLSNLTEDKTAKKAVGLFVKNAKEPLEEDVLNSLIYVGLKPSFKEMLDYLDRWSK